LPPPSVSLFPYTTLFRSEWRVLAKSLDVVARRLIAIVEQLLAIFGGRVQHGHRSAEHVSHCIAEPPPAAFPGTAVEHFRHELLRSEEHTSELQSRGHLVC